MAEFNTVDDFLNHKGSEGGSGKRLKSWAKDPGYMNFWLHTKQMPCSVWFHRIPELVVRQDKDDRTIVKKNVWGRQHACWEDESILKKQRFRTPEGRREHPPTKCGICRLVEAIRELVIDGKLQDTDVLFEFTGSDDPTENKVLHAGGFANMWKREADDEEKSRLKKHGIYLNKAWDENAQAKLNYVFAGVNHDAVQDGLQIAVQTQLLGDKVKRTIRNEIASKDGDDGNPFIKPYCIRFLYKAEEKKFDDKYDALRIDRLKMSPEIEKLIRGERPDISRFTRKFNQKDMRATLEKHATPLARKTLPWDAIFDVPGYGEEQAEEKQETSSPSPQTEEKPAGRTRVQESPAEEMGDPCDDCGAAMTKTQTQCKKCGAKYANDDTPAGPSPGEKAKNDGTLAPDPSGDEPVYDSDVPF